MKDLTNILCSYLEHEVVMYNDLGDGTYTEDTLKGIGLPEHILLKDGGLDEIGEWKPILRPLSKLTEKEINNLLEPDLLRMHIKEGITPNYRKTDLEYLYSLHADVHNLIESGQAIDVNILETNPYE